MIWTLPDGVVVRGSAAMKRLCRERGLDWTYFRNRSQKGLARRRGGRRHVRLPDDWRARLDSIFGAEAVHVLVKEIPPERPAIVVAVNATDTKWCQHMMAASSCICGVRGRLNYIDGATGKLMRGNPRGTLVLCYADDAGDVVRFREAMRDVGWLT